MVPVVVITALLSMAAQAKWQAPTIKLDSVADEIESYKRIKVRIFPHRRHFAPHWRDVKKTHFSVVSEKPCLIYEADKNGERVGRVLAKTRKVWLRHWRLQTAIRIDCPGGFRLIRPGKVPSFKYVGHLVIRKVRNKKTRAKELLAVNDVPLEVYLKGVVPAEVMASWPEETLKSQAVAARTYAIFHMSYARNKKSLYDVDDSIVYQAYTGISNLHERTNKAVEATAGEIVTHKDQVIQAYYHADSGGRVDSCAQIFRIRAAYCVAKKEPYKLSLVRSSWRKEMTLAEFSRRMKNAGHVKKDVVSVLVPKQKRTKGGRVKSIRLRLLDGSSLDLPIARLKRTIALNSSLFNVAVDESAKLVQFKGRGSGHGVGMNQTGAKVLAEKYEWDYRRILGFYYHKTRVCSVYDEGNQPNSCFMLDGV